MITPDAATAALSPVRDLVTADGGDLILERVEDATVVLRLVLDTAECAECVMPRAFLETVALDLMAPALSGLDGVRIIDPRDVGG